MLEKEREIKEIFDLEHFNDDKFEGFDYETNLYKKIMSPLIFNNDNMNTFLMKLQKGSIWMIDSVSVVRNMFDHAVDKYYKHPN